MLKLTTASLAGGQGKTTIALFVAKMLALRGQRVLAVDVDPQHNLTLYTRVHLKASDPSLLEVLKKEVATGDAIFKSVFDNLWVLPADRGLDAANAELAARGMADKMLRNRLKLVEDRFDFCIIDAPPQGSPLTLTAICAADQLVIPVETTVKGLNTLNSTLKTVFEMEEEGGFLGNILGVMPFRLRFVGSTLPKSHLASLESIKKAGAANEIQVLSPVRESEAFQKAIGSGGMPGDFTPGVDEPISEVVDYLLKK